MAIFEFKLPDIGEGIHEGEIVKWHIKAGDQVQEDQIIMDVQNDKAVVEIPSPVHGKVIEIKVPEGTVSVVGDVLVTFEVEGAGSSPSQAEEVKEDCAVGSSVAANVAQAKVETPLAAVTSDRKVLATPSVRKLAREKGAVLAEIPATGKNGRITKDDVLQFVSGEATYAADSAADVETVEQPVTATTSAAPVIVGDRVEERVQLKGVRKVIANAMVKSMYTAPHVTMMDEVDVTHLVALREKAKPLAEQKGVKLTYLPFIVKALVASVKQFPVLNAMIDEERNEIVYKKYYNIGIATDTDNGLLVPVVNDADRKNMWTIASEIKDLATRGREGKLAAHELKGSTITITNIGSSGGLYFTPVINFPEVAILGTGRITEKPVVKNGEITIAPMMSLSLSFDHRIIDGGTAQHFINYLKQLLEDPQLLVMEV